MAQRKTISIFCQLHPRIRPLEASVTLSNMRVLRAHVCVCVCVVVCVCVCVSDIRACKHMQAESNFWITIANSF
jgi:hypothetical protein